MSRSGKRILNIRLQSDLLNNAELLARVIAAVDDEFSALDGRDSIGAADAARYVEALTRAGRARLLAPRRVEVAKACHEDAPQLEALPFGYPAQRDAFQLVEVFTSLWGVSAMPRIGALRAVAIEPTGSPAEILTSVFAKHLAGGDADAFGINLGYESQAGCALLLARCLRAWFPGELVVAGGVRACAPPCRRRSARGPPRRSVLGEGEVPLARMCRCRWPPITTTSSDRRSRRRGIVLHRGAPL